LDNYEPEWRYGKLIVLRDIYRFLQDDPSFRGFSPAGLIEFQRRAIENGEDFLLLDKLEEFIRSKKGTRSSLKQYLSTVRGFFKKNRVQLPEDDFKIRTFRPRVMGRGWNMYLTGKKRFPDVWTRHSTYHG